MIEETEYGWGINKKLPKNLDELNSQAELAAELIEKEIKPDSVFGKTSQYILAQHVYWMAAGGNNELVGKLEEAIYKNKELEGEDREPLEDAKKTLRSY